MWIEKVYSGVPWVFGFTQMLQKTYRGLSQHYNSDKITSSFQKQQIVLIGDSIFQKGLLVIKNSKIEYQQVCDRSVFKVFFLCVYDCKIILTQKYRYILPYLIPQG